MFGFHIRTTTLPLLVVFFLSSAYTSAFLRPLGKRISPRYGLGVAQDIERPSTFLDEKGDDSDLGVLFIDEADGAEDEEAEDEDEESAEETPQKEKGAGRRRWENLNPKIKQRLVEKGQAKAIANKKKREPARDKKRRKYE